MPMPTTRLLLIEDDYDVAEMLLTYFNAFSNGRDEPRQPQSYDMIHADTGAMGVTLARTKFPHLILLDLMLPDMDGYRIYESLRAVSITRYIPILFLTQRSEAAYRVYGLELGADDYIAKPFDIEELRLRVERSIQRAARDHIHEARTGLPTGKLIDDEIAARQGAKGGTLLRIIIEGYAVFRDVYGFITADQVVTFAARAIHNALIACGTVDDFIGMAGDQFVVLTYARDVRPFMREFQTAFNSGVRAFYAIRDVERGGVVLHDDDGLEQLAPLMSLSVHRG